MTATRDNKGFSLPEVMTVVAIIGVMSAVAVPSFLSWLSNKGIQSAARDLYSNMRKAQSFAVKRNRNCAVTFNGATGYVVYVDENKNFSNDAGEVIIAQKDWSAYRDVQVDSITYKVNATGDRTVAFQPNLMPLAYGGLTPNGQAKLKNSTSRQLSVVVSSSGHISLQ